MALRVDYSIILQLLACPIGIINMLTKFEFTHMPVCVILFILFILALLQHLASISLFCEHTPASPLCLRPTAAGTGMPAPFAIVYIHTFLLSFEVAGKL